MNTKLTLTLEKQIIKQAKHYANQKGSSLSELVENYFKCLTESSQHQETTELSPKIKKLRGILKVNEDFNYKKILEEERLKKHGF